MVLNKRVPHASADGFTIVEVLMVTIVTALIFFTSLLIISSLQNESEFTMAVGEFQARLQQIITDIGDRNYPISTSFMCVNSLGRPVITAGFNARGTNPNCIFLGNAIQLTVTASITDTNCG